jgi:hypothetical protein
LYANANLGTATTNITTLFSNAASQATALNTFDANLGTATTNITTLFSNAATQAASIDSVNSNVTAANSSINTFTTGVAPPVSGNISGDQWYSSTDVLYEYVNDGTNSYWVDIQTPTGIQGPTGPTGPTGPAGTGQAASIAYIMTLGF